MVSDTMGTGFMDFCRIRDSGARCTIQGLTGLQDAAADFSALRWCWTCDGRSTKVGNARSEFTGRCYKCEKFVNSRKVVMCR